MGSMQELEFEFIFLQYMIKKKHATHTTTTYAPLMHNQVTVKPDMILFGTIKSHAK